MGFTFVETLLFTKFLCVYETILKKETMNLRERPKRLERGKGRENMM